jgi:plastocyanin
MTATAEMTDKVEIADYKYAPAVIQVDAGTKVTFTNSDDTKHTATADDSSFDTGDLDQGDSKTITFDQPGEFTYYCRYHPFMKATVEVPN